jgi:hypothetical protein
MILEQLQRQLRSAVLKNGIPRLKAQKYRLRNEFNATAPNTGSL